MMRKEAKELSKSIKELRKFEVDLAEVKLLGDLDYQVKRLGVLLDDLDDSADVLIHGSGTGSD